MTMGRSYHEIVDFRREDLILVGFGHGQVRLQDRIQR